MWIRLLKLRERIRRHVRGMLATVRDTRKISQSSGRSQLAMLAEAVTLALRGRMAPDTYLLYRLFDPSIPRKDTYISNAPRANDRMWSTLTPPKYRCLYDNKYAFRRMFSGFPLARLYGVFDEQLGFTTEGGRLTNAAELENLAKSLHEGFVFKPVEGIKGNLTLVFGPPKDGRLCTISGEPYDAERIIRESRNTTMLRIQNWGVGTSSFMVEERLKPHGDLEALIGPTFCTARMLTVIARDGSPRVAAAVFKLQTEPLGVDHFMHGAVASWIGEDGSLGRGRARNSYDWIDTLPNGNRFVGFRLPHWDRMRELALDAARSFPWARAIGWDIGICDDGPRIVEGNERWGPSLLQLAAPHGIMDGELKAVYDELRSRTS